MPDYTDANMIIRLPAEGIEVARVILEDPDGGIIVRQDLKPPWPVLKPGGTFYYTLETNEIGEE